MQEKIVKALSLACSPCGDKLKKQLQLWHDYLAYEKKASAHTTYNYILDISAFFTFLKDYLGEKTEINTIPNLSLRHFRAFLAYRVSQNSSAVSNKRAISAIKNFFSFLEKRLEIKNTAINQLKSPKTEKNLPKPIAHIKINEITDLKSLYQKQPLWIKLRDEALIMLLYGCGLRISEALNLNVKDLHADALRILGKRNKERIAPMIPLVFEKVQSYLKTRPDTLEPESPLFIGAKGDRLNPRTFQKNIEKIRVFYGLPATTTPHSLRHSFASHLLAGGADLRSIQELLGHDSLASTQVYTKLEDHALYEVYMKAHPKAKPRN